MRLSSIRLKRNVARLLLSASFSFGGESHRLWYSRPVEHARWFSTDRFDGFVVALLLCATRSAEDLQVEGPMSSRLWHSLNGSYIPMVAKVFGLPAIKLTAAALLEQETSAQGVATGFSGGIDSFAAIIQHFVRIPHLLSGSATCSSTMWAPTVTTWVPAVRRRQTVPGPCSSSDSRGCGPLAEELGLPLVCVDSNISEVVPIDFLRMHHALNVAVPLVLQNQFQRYFYAFRRIGTRIAAWPIPMISHIWIRLPSIYSQPRRWIVFPLDATFPCREDPTGRHLRAFLPVLERLR